MNPIVAATAGFDAPALFAGAIKTVLAAVPTLLGVVIGGSIAFVTARVGDRRRQRFEESRRWDEKIVDLYSEVDDSTWPIYEVRSLTDGDVAQFKELNPRIHQALNTLGRCIASFEIIAPNAEEAARELREAGKRIRNNARDARQSTDEEWDAFHEAHAAVIAAVKRDLRIETAEK